MEGFDEVRKRDESSICMMKKRRTKRPRHHDMSSSSLSSDNSSGGFDRRSLSNDSDTELTHHRVEVEEEDMAKCLMLLSQGHIKKPPLPQPPQTAPPSAAAAGMNREVYECKTCNRIFPSFQALGGHRASHRKPKTAEQQNQESADDVTTLSLQIPGGRAAGNSPPRTIINKSNRIHECSICGAEFSSGQALGGHMRRHRPLPSIAAANSGGREESSDQEIKKPRYPLALDLNLPAPEDDHREITKFPFASKEQVIVFSASPLVDCHY